MYLLSTGLHSLFSVLPKAMGIWTAFFLFGLLLGTGNPSCPWSALGGKFYKFFNTKVGWADAEVHCLKNGGNLASVHNKEENFFIQNLIKQATGSNTRTWIGGYDAVKEGTWLWSDGLEMNFKNWGYSQPSNYLGKEHCIEAHLNGTMTTAAQRSRSFVLEEARSSSRDFLT
uniref:C-type lectin domain-containing protein n=1 Tax=Astyanax mexicanus TaxID=7994 RepID=W5L325_ASTMX